MTKRKPDAKMGRPYVLGEPQNVRVCSYFTRTEFDEMEEMAAQESERDGRRVTVAELMRRATRLYLRGVL